MITELTQKQADSMSTYRDRWIKKGLCTEQSTEKDFEKCFEAVKSLV
jgi:hypothetical protein